MQAIYRKILDKIAGGRVLFFVLAQPFINLLYRKKALKILKERSRCSLNNISKLSEDIPSKFYYAATDEKEKFNDFYGIASVLKSFARLPQNKVIKAYIEHAITFTDYSCPSENDCAYKSVILCGDFRENVLLKEKINKKIIKIGPYINYASPYLPQEKFRKEKKRLGKNILAFPAHSVPRIDVDYDIKSFSREVLSLKKKYKYDSARVCLYWKDARLEKTYRDLGFEVVSAGHQFDPLFLPRLRTLIELADLTISNGVGSHIGYSLSLRVPHYLVMQKVKINYPKGEFDKNLNRKFDQTKENLHEVFGKYSEKITKRQWEAMNVFSGFDHPKSSDELSKILSNLS